MASEGFYCSTLFNTSLTNGYFPTQWKITIVKPLIKKAGLDKTLTSNYRSVSNLPFLSKVLERIVHRQLTNHLNRHNLLPDVQIAYRKRFSTKTAVLKVYSDIIDAISNEKIFFCPSLTLRRRLTPWIMTFFCSVCKRHSASAALCFSGSVLTLATDLRVSTYMARITSRILQYVVCLKDLYWAHFFLYYIQLTSVILFDHMDFIIMRMLMTIRFMHPVHHRMPWS